MIPGRVIVTGGAGFIGSEVVRQALERWPDTQVVTVDALTYAGHRSNLEAADGNPRHRFVEADIRDAGAMDALVGEVKPDALIHLAAESHVDRSIEASTVFLETNVVGTGVLLEAARRHGVRRFLHVSTDEVYGDVPEPHLSRPEDPLLPRSPYAASKAASDLLARSHFTTHGLGVVITRGCNTYGPYQFPEKLLPLAITNLLLGEPVPVYGDGRQVREWIHVTDHARGILMAVESGVDGEIYPMASGERLANEDILMKVLALMGRDASVLRRVADRPGHDRRYAMDPEPSRAALGFTPVLSLQAGLEATVAWYRDHRAWWEERRSGSYADYYRRQVAQRAGWQG